MATVSRAEVKDMYSWWWDSHISPKNSKWLQENLTDMDSKVRTMIKLIEVDEDSFARRAEMYYKKRPELMKLVEEFYRAYRALAERYDHATGVIRKAHRIFPNEVSLLMSDDEPVNPSHDSDPRTPEMLPPERASFDPDELQKGAMALSSADILSGKANGDFTNESNPLAERKGSKQLDGFGKARKGLNFHEVDDGEEGVKKSEKHNVQTQVLSESERLGKSETAILALKEALAKLQVEKKDGQYEYLQILERLSKLESEVSQAKQDSEGFGQRASKAEAEVQTLKETLAKVEAEREASLLQYLQCLDRISNLENHISRAEQNAGQLHERAFKAEKETELLKEELTRLKNEKDSLLSKYLEALEKIANLENKLLLAEDYASRISDRADRAEKEVETLKETITRLTVEKDAAVLKYEQCLEKIAVLEIEITLTEKETERLKAEVQHGAAKLKGAEEQCILLDRSNKSLRSEVDSLVEKVGIQNQELSEKQKEMGRLWTYVQEERMRFMEAETAFQSLQNLHSKVQEELRSVAAELQKKVQCLKEIEIQNQHLVDEVQKVKDENKSLNDLNFSSAVSIKNMQGEIFELKDGKGMLEQELQLQIDQRNALQQEVYCLTEELNSLNQKHQDLLVQMESVGFDPESFGSSVKKLKDENSKLKDNGQRSNVEIAALVEKLAIMEKLLEKIELLENSLSDLSAELEHAREKVKALEESCEMLTGEKSTLAAEKTTLVSQLQVTSENLEKLSERNTFLEISLSDANAELEMLRVKSKNLDDSCRLLNGQNAVLVTEKQTLASQMEWTQQSLEDLAKRHADLEKRYSGLEAEREVTLQRVEELQVCLNVEKQEHANSRQLSRMQIAKLEKQICVLQKVGGHMREEFEEEIDKAVNAQFEILILQKSIQDLKVQNTLLLGYCEKLIEASQLSEKLVSELELTSHEQEEVRMLSSQIKGLRTGMFQLLEALETDTGLPSDGYEDEDQRIHNLIFGKIGSIKGSLSQVLDENQELVIQKSVLVAVLRQLKQDVGDLNAVIIIFREEISDKNEQLLVVQKEMQKLLESNEDLILKVRDGNQREVDLLIEMENLHEKLFGLQGAYEDLQKEKTNVIQDKESLMNAFEVLEEEKHNIEHDCSCIVGEAVALDNLSVIFKNVLSEKSMQVTELRENIDKLCSDNGLLVERIRIIEAKLEEVQAKNINLEFLLKKSENELEEARVVNNQLKDEITNAEDLFYLKEMKLLEAEAVKVHQENKILELADNYAQQLEECEGLRDVIQHLDSQISEMRKENEETETRVGFLSSELQKGKDEVKLWETVAGAFFTELQSCSVREALIREKFSELMKAYETLEEESHSKGMDNIQLRERVAVLEDKNCEIKAQLAADLSAISSLRDSVASLEKHTIWHAKLLKTDNEEKEEPECCQSLSEDKAAAAQLGGFVDLKELQARVQAVEKSVIELKQHAEEEYLTLRTDLDSATRHIEILKSQNSLRRGSGRLSRRFPSHTQEDLKRGSTSGCKSQKSSPDGSEPGDELRMKDIVLDRVSDCSSSGKNRRIMGSDDQILELWQTMDQGGSIDLTVGKPYRPAAGVPNKYSHLESVKENKSGRPSSESMVEKELGVDEQQSSKRFLNAHQEDTKRKTLERLASDVQKLTNLQITVQDLKEKLEITENYGKGKGVQCDSIKDQLGEIEETILKLFDYSAKLMKKIEKSSPTSFDVPSTADSSDGSSTRRRRCSEQARRISEKIGRLQLEVQKLQFNLMKLDNNKVSKGGTRITERNTRILLRDYLYGVSRTPRRRKRTHFCGCVQPPTKGD